MSLFTYSHIIIPSKIKVKNYCSLQKKTTKESQKRATTTRINKDKNNNQRQNNWSLNAIGKETTAISEQ